VNQGYLMLLKQRIARELAAHAPTGTLNESQHRTVAALFAELTSDDSFSAERLRTHVDSGTQATPGLLREFISAVNLLDTMASRLMGSADAPFRSFADLSASARRRVLEATLNRYPHPTNESQWRRRLHLTSENMHMVLSNPTGRRFRDHVVRNLLTYYYSSTDGWNLVGYTEHPGRVRSEWEPCTVRSIQLDGDALVLELSDGCFETLNPSALEPDERTELAVRTKSSRQRATFSHSAYQALSEYLEVDDGGWVLKIGERSYPILR